MTTKQKYTLAYRMLRYYGDFQTFNTMCSSYGIEQSIRQQAFRSYMESRYE